MKRDRRLPAAVVEGLAAGVAAVVVVAEAVAVVAVVVAGEAADVTAAAAVAGVIAVAAMEVAGSDAGRWRVYLN
jgi:hypothetical protein